MLSDDMISLRHLPRRSSKNCDLQFANNGRFKANYSIDYYRLNMHDDEAVSCMQVMYEYQSLENFWKRYNRVLLDRVALDKEKSDLLHENQQLRTLLKQYLDGISVNDEILNQVNPLFVVNHRTNVNIR